MADNWEHGLCDQVCGGDCGTCLSAWFCSCFLYGRTDERLRKFPETNKDKFDNCSSGCWIFCAASCFSMQWLVALLKRGEMRDRFGIKGSAGMDCLLSCCCTPCMLAQMETEVKDRALRAGNGGAGMHDVKSDASEYTSPAPQGGMHYGQQAPGAPAPASELLSETPHGGMHYDQQASAPQPLPASQQQYSSHQQYPQQY